jgi:cytosine/adenosine deaminase-related metal-dependent hydrolase
LSEQAPTKVLCGGTVVTGHRPVDIRSDADLWIRGNRILAIAPSGQRGIPAGCEVIDARGCIVMPGLIDTHRHLWQTVLRGMSSDLIAPEYRHELRDALVPMFRPEDVFISTLSGALEALDCGITTVLDWGHIMNGPEYADASVAALRASGLRAVFAHSAPNDSEATQWWSNSDRKHPRDVVRLRRILTDIDAKVTMAFGARAPQLVQRDVRIHDWKLARELELRIVTDGGIGGGLWGPRTFPIRLLNDDGLLSSDTVYVHCNNLAEDEYQLIADTGGFISISPCAEMQVGFGMPGTNNALKHGIRPALSTDSVAFVAGDMFGTMRSTLAVYRGLLGYLAFQEGQGVTPWQITTSDILEFATWRGAAALGISDRVGTLAEGKLADIVVLNTQSLRLSPNNNPLATIVLQATPADVDTVLVGGDIVKRKGILSCDQNAVRRDLLKSRDWLMEQGGAELGPSVKSRLLDAGMGHLGS